MRSTMYFYIDLLYSLLLCIILPFSDIIYFVINPGYLELFYILLIGLSELGIEEITAMFFVPDPRNSIISEIWHNRSVRNSFHNRI